MLSPHFAFGVVADVQFADIPDGASFAGTPRHYRSSLTALERGVAVWQNQNLAFLLQLGDIIDGYARDAPDTTLDSVLQCLEPLDKPILHILGNHCFYNLPRTTLNTRLGLHAWTRNPTATDAVPLPPAPVVPNSSPAPPTLPHHAHSYYSISPVQGWRVVVVDAYDVSMLGWPEDHPHYAQAQAILAQENINQEKNSPEGMVGVQRRFVKFGGGIGQQQLQWLQGQLQAAHAAGELVVIAGHLPFYPDTAPPACLIWNYDQVLDVLQSFPNVVLTLAGHAHHDGWRTDEAGIHHRVIASALEAPKGCDCHGVVQVFADRLEIQGEGYMTSATVPHRSAALHFAAQHAQHAARSPVKSMRGAASPTGGRPVRVAAVGGYRIV